MNDEMAKEIKEFAILKNKRYDAGSFDDYITHVVSYKIVNSELNSIDALSFIRWDFLAIFLNRFLNHLDNAKEISPSILKVVTFYISTYIFKDNSLNKMGFLNILFTILYLGEKYISEEKIDSYIKHIKDNEINGRLDSEEIAIVISRMMKDIKDAEI